jgi:pimeloyl-ACP methyl ester carboxylesterase
MIRDEVTDSGLAVRIPVGPVTLQGDLSVPPGAAGAVLFAHGSGSSRHSPRNRHVAATLRGAGFGTLLADLLTEDEEFAEARTGELRFDVGLLARRLAAIIDWMDAVPAVRSLPAGLFGASTGGGAALVAATMRPDRVRAVVSRGGRPDLAGDALPEVRCPVLLLVGGRDDIVLELNEQALEKLGSREKELVVVPGATHLFEEPGTLDAVAGHAAEWFATYLRAERR